MSGTNVKAYVKTPEDLFLESKGFDIDTYHVNKRGDVVRKPKINAVRDHLKKYKNLTSWEAIQKYRVTRLAAIIFVLKKNELLNIVTVNKTSPKGVKFASYHLNPQYAIK